MEWNARHGWWHFMKLLPGFRDFFPEDCARRNALTALWRETARRHGFLEYDGPVLESTDLYRKKSGGELFGQLFQFEDKGGRDVSMRPEMTPTFARMIIASERQYRKPIKWFSIVSCFRHEKQQRGRLREFIQFNADLVGESGPAADADIIALTIDIFRACGLGEKEIVVRLSSRDAWMNFLTTRGIDLERVQDFLQIIDKLERSKPEEQALKLAEFSTTLEEVRAFIAEPTGASTELDALIANLEARGLAGFCEIDLTIVRGLAYYTGTVFEVFDRERKSRALAGGGRYDRLLHALSDGSVDLPAIGVGIGDVTLNDLLDSLTIRSPRLAELLDAASKLDVFLVIADESRREAALRLATELRDANLRVDFSSKEMKVGKQFQVAEQSLAAVAVVLGAEWPAAKLKVLADRTEVETTRETLAADLEKILRRSGGE